MIHVKGGKQNGHKALYDVSHKTTVESVEFFIRHAASPGFSGFFHRMFAPIVLVF